MAVTEAVVSEVAEVSVGETVEATEVVVVVEEDSEGATKWEEGWWKLSVFYIFNIS